MTPHVQMPELPRVSDAPVGNWVDRFAPAKSRPYLRLSRADRPIGTWLLLIPCLWGIALAALPGGFRAWDIWLVVSCAAGAFLMRGAGCTWNDISDRDIDARVERTKSRPLPSGQVSVAGALAWMVIQSVVAAAILFSYNGLAIALGVGSLALVAVYPFAKRFTWWPQAFLGLAFNWGALLAYAAHSGTLTVSAVFLYAAGIFWTLFYDTIYAHQDKDDDALIGVKSTARLFGTHTNSWLRGFMAGTVLCMAMAVILQPLSPDAALSLIVALIGVWGFCAHMAWSMRRLNVDDAASCLAVFRSSRDGGLIAALFLATAVFL